MNESPTRDLETIAIDKKIWKKKKKKKKNLFQKDFLKIRLNFEPSKVHNKFD
jgi:hypothetical protein